MNRDDIIRMARDCGWTPFESLSERFERFFQLAYAAGAAAERNAILQMSNEQWFKTQADFETAIRERGQE